MQLAPHETAKHIQLRCETYCSGSSALQKPQVGTQKGMDGINANLCVGGIPSQDGWPVHSSHPFFKADHAYKKIHM